MENPPSFSLVHRFEQSRRLSRKKSPHSPNDESVLACRRGTMFVKKKRKMIDDCTETRAEAFAR
jgi:hypothetical protein